MALLGPQLVAGKAHRDLEQVVRSRVAAREASLGIKATGWPAFQELLSGPRAQVAFVRPCAVAVAGERVYVADMGLGVVHLLDLAARRYVVIPGSPSERFRVPVDLVVARQQLLVVDRGRAAVDSFDLDGSWRTTYRCPEVTSPVAISWDEARRLYWLADAAAHVCFATADLQHVAQQIGQRGEAPGRFNYPTALAVHPDVGLVVADAMNFRVQVFDEARQLAAVFGHKGDAAGDFARPRDVVETRATPRFTALSVHIWRTLESEVRRAGQA